MHHIDGKIKEENENRKRRYKAVIVKADKAKEGEEEKGKRCFLSRNAIKR